MLYCCVIFGKKIIIYLLSHHFNNENCTNFWMHVNYKFLLILKMVGYLKNHTFYRTIRRITENIQTANNAPVISYGETLDNEIL